MTRSRPASLSAVVSGRRPVGGAPERPSPPGGRGHETIPETAVGRHIRRVGQPGRNHPVRPRRRRRRQRPFLRAVGGNTEDSSCHSTNDAPSAQLLGNVRTHQHRALAGRGEKLKVHQPTSIDSLRITNRPAVASQLGDQRSLMIRPRSWKAIRTMWPRSGPATSGFGRLVVRLEDLA